MTATLDVIDSYLALDSTQYAQVPIGATRVATKGNGTNLYGTIPTWTATNWEIEFDIVFPTTGPEASPVNILDCTASGSNRVGFYTSATTGTMRWLSATAVYYDGNSIADNTIPYPLDGAVHHIKMVGSGATRELATILCRYSLENYSLSTLFNLRLTDLNNPANSRFYPLNEDFTNRKGTKGNGSNVYGTIPTWSATDWEVEFDVVFPTTVSGNSECLIDSSTSSNRRNVLVDSGGLFQRNSTGFSGYLDGGTLYGQAQPTDGAVHHIKLVGSALSIDVTNILQNYVGSIRSRASIFNLRLTDLGTPSNSRFYAMSNDATSASFTDSSANAQHGTWYNRSSSDLLGQFDEQGAGTTKVGIWYNRTSGDVVTVYPDAIKPGEEFYFAIKYKVTDVSKNSGFNNPFSIGRRASGAYSCISLYLPESNGKFYVDPYNGLSRTTGSGIPGRTMGVTHLDGLTHVAVVRLKTDGSYEFWVDADTPKYTGVPNSQLAYAMDVINLNGYANATTGAVARMGINFHYVYLYSALSGADITALMQGANPETVGTIRQGYNLNGNGNEVNGGNVLTLYNAPTFVRSSLFPRLVDRMIRHNMTGSIIGSVVSTG